MVQLVLASTSPMRQQLLASVGLSCLAVPSGVDESIVQEDDPVALVRALALQKAVAVAATHPTSLVIGADQVVFDPAIGAPWGKPPTKAIHLERLRHMRGRPHHLVTGFAVVGPGVCHVDHERTALTVRGDLEDRELEAYVDFGEGQACAGGYAAEGHGAFLFESIDGDWSNVMGLPVFRLFTVLRSLGWRYGGSP